MSVTSTAKVGAGTLIKMGDGATTEVFTAIGEIRTLNWTGRQRPAVSASLLAAAAAEYIAGHLDNGEFAGDFNLLSSDTLGQTLLETNFEAGTCTNFQVVIPTATPITYDFAAVITDLGDSYPLEDAMVRSFTLKVSGAVVKT